LNYPDNNPKTLVGASKVPLHLVPPSAKVALAEALADGAKKYGPYNWRKAMISVSVYVGAAERHLDSFWDGEELAEDSGVHHLKHAMACIALMIDAMTVGKLNDDRPPPGMASELQAIYASKGDGKLKPTEQWQPTRTSHLPLNDEVQDVRRGYPVGARTIEEVEAYIASLNVGWDANGSPVS
jgi:Domain of unknown function (DUF5664)